MHFGEYELSPSLIGLSLLHTTHPGTFQRLLVRPSIPCYRNFSLVMCRSLGFASTPSNYTYITMCFASQSFALFGLAFASVPVLKTLTSLKKVTRRFIMQKARRHPSWGLRQLVSEQFQGLFHSSIRSAFHLSLTVLVHYRSVGSI